KTSGQQLKNQETKEHAEDKVLSLTNRYNPMDIDHNPTLDKAPSTFNVDYNHPTTRSPTSTKKDPTSNDFLSQITATKTIEEILSKQKSNQKVDNQVPSTLYITPMFNKSISLSSNSNKLSPSKNTTPLLPKLNEQHHGQISPHQLPMHAQQKQEKCLDETTTKNTTPFTLPTHEPTGANNLHNTTITNESCSTVMAGVRADRLLPQSKPPVGRARHHDSAGKSELPCSNSDGGVEDRAGQRCKSPRVGHVQQPNAFPNPPHLGDSPITLEQTTTTNSYCSYRVEHATTLVPRNHTLNSNTLPATTGNPQCRQPQQSNTTHKPNANSSSPKPSYSNGTK
ncbi:hypothetical protein A4A49_57261, partial [Nicotiana attenuata]